MPHPEHAVDPLLGSGDGALLLAALVDAAAAHARRRLTAAAAARSEPQLLEPGVLRERGAQLLQVAQRSVTGLRRATPSVA